MDLEYYKPEYMVSALLAVTGSLSILDSLSTKYFVMYDNIWLETELNLGFDPTIILLITVLTQMLFFIRKEYRSYVFVPFFSAFLLRGWGWSLGLSVGGIILVTVYLYYEKGFKVFSFWTLVTLSIFMSLAVFHWAIFYPLSIDLLSQLAFIENQLFYILVHFSPYVYLLVIIYSIFTFLNRGVSFPEPQSYIKSGAMSKLHLGLLIILLISSVFLASYPYFEAVNPLNSNLGYDLADYIENLDLMGGDPSQAFTVKEGSRPVIYLLLWGFKTVFGLSSVSTVRGTFAILNLLMVFSSYLFAYNAYDDRDVAILGSFFALFGFPVVVGMSAGFLANLLALSIQYTSLCSLFISVRRKSTSYLIASSFLGILVLFTHPWSFVQFTGVALLFTLLAFFKYRAKVFEVIESRHLIFYSLVLIGAEIIRSLFFSGIGGAVALGELSGGLTNLSSFWEAVNLSTWFIYGGLYGDSILIIFVLFSIVTLDKSKLEGYYLSLFMFITSIVWLIGNAIIKDRLFYNTPFWLFSSYGLLRVLRSKDYGYAGKMLLIFIVVSHVTYAFRGLANHL